MIIRIMITVSDMNIHDLKIDDENVSLLEIYNYKYLFSFELIT